MIRTPSHSIPTLASTALALLLSLPPATADTAESTALIALLPVGAEVPQAAAAEIGCTALRSGTITKAQGPMKVGDPGGFALLACDRPILHDAGRRDRFGPAVALFEGDFAHLADAWEDPAGRQYILKLSRYNNADIGGREGDLAAIGKQAKDREDHWVTEAFVNVDDAVGLPTPDEVVVLYYQSADKAEAFRSGNKDILAAVGAFNRAHLTDFVYLTGTAR